MTERFSARVTQAFAAAGIPPALAVRAATAESPAEILLYDEIGCYGITAKDFMATLAAAGAGPVKVRINSPGGDVFAGLSIYNALKAHPGGVTCVVDGLAASAASVIALAGDRLEMAQNSMLMIHRAWGVTVGNTNDMTSTAAVLAKIDGQMVGIYAEKTGGDPDEIMAAVDAETWFTADEAVTAKYCDAVVSSPAKATKAKAQADAEATKAKAQADAAEVAEIEAHALAVKKSDLRARIAMAAE
jgi:ATP-dependent Clp protease protease subunit